eukprot:8818893-Heterocapsa_arctica.AAC.1
MGQAPRLEVHIVTKHLILPQPDMTLLVHPLQRCGADSQLTNTGVMDRRFILSARLDATIHR